MSKLTIASSEALSTFYTQACDLADILKEEGVATEVEVLVTNASIANAKMVASGEADLGFMASNWAPRAIAGEAPFTAPADIAIVTPLNAGPIFFVARADSPLERFADLRGKRVAVGLADSGMAQHALNLVRTLGWGDDGFERVHISTFDGGDALISGEVDAQLQAPIPSTHFTELTQKADVKVLPFGAGEIAAVCESIPFYFPATIPAEFVPGQSEDLPAVGVLNVIVAAGDAAAGRIEPIIAAFIRRASDLAARNPLYRGLPEVLAAAKSRGQAALAPGGVPLHAGAAAAFRAAGLLA